MASFHCHNGMRRCLLADRPRYRLVFQPMGGMVPALFPAWAHPSYDFRDLRSPDVQPDAPDRRTGIGNFRRLDRARQVSCGRANPRIANHETIADRPEIRRNTCDFGRHRSRPILAAVRPVGRRRSRRLGRNRFFVPIVKYRPRYWVDPAQVIIHALHAGRVFCSHDDRLPLPFISDHSPKFDHTISDYDVYERERRPRLRCELRHQPFANGLIAGRNRLDLTCHTRQGMHEIGTTDDTDDFLPPYHRQTLDSPFLHHLDDLIEQGVLGDGQRIGGHDFADLVTVAARVLIGKAPPPDQVLKPTGPPALSSSLGAPQEITFSHDPDQPPLLVDHRQSADVS